MPNVGAVLKGEISRVSKKATRAQLGPILQASSSQRKQLAALKKQVLQLERQVAALLRQARKAAPEEAEAGETVKFRFTAKGLRSLRRRLGLSAGDFGRLLQVGGQTIYNWENEKASPRRAQIPAIASLRKIGRREVKARLESLGTGS